MYLPIACTECKALDFLNCSDPSKGTWNFKPLELQAKILYKVLGPPFGVHQMPLEQWRGRSKNSKETRLKMSKKLK